MKIVRVTPYVLDYALPQAFESASMRFDRRQHCLVEVVCDDGTVGWGECLGPARLNAAVVRQYGEALRGADPLETEKCWLMLYHLLRDHGQRGLTMTALSGIDIALWDIKGQHFQTSIATLLGGRFREQVAAYATGSFRLDGMDRVQSVADEVAGYAREGFRAVKIKIGFDVEEDLRVIAAAREAIGPDVRLMIDANHGYDALEAIELGQRAATYQVDWFEEPVVPEQLAAYRAVHQGQPIPVASGENWHGREAMSGPLSEAVVDILQPDVCAVGGLTEMRKVVDLAHHHGVRVMPHVWGTTVAIAASLQCLAALPPYPPRRTPREPMMEFDRTVNPFRQAVVKTPLEHQQGMMTIPSGPGLGIEINPDALDQYLVQDSH